MNDAGFGRIGKLSARPSNRAISFALAIVLPVLSAIITSRSQLLHAVPYSLHFVSMAIIACYGGFAPALLSVLISTIANHFLVPDSQHVSATLTFLRPLILVVSAAVISLLTLSLRRSAAALVVALARLQEQSAALIESQQASKCASWTFDYTGRTRWYPGGYEVFGIPFSEVERLPSPLSLVYPEDQPALAEAFEGMLANRIPMLIEHRVLWPNGELHWNLVRGNPHESNPRLWRGVTFDITERKLAELALIRSEKLAAMGRLASTIAHEINNPLEAVTNLLYLARRDPLIRRNTDEYLATAERELARIGEITRLALGFIRNSPERRDVEIVDGIEDVLSLFRHRFEMKNIAIHREYVPGVMIKIAPQELRQIATNLISNALDATAAPNGRVDISISREQNVAVLLVQDNGSGVTKSDLPRIFDPFFSTKEDTGTGIGLWVTRELVEKNGGTISVESGYLPGGASTCFRVEFPLRRASIPEAGSEVSHLPYPS